MSHGSRLAIALTLAAGAVPAQEKAPPLEGRDFLPQHYQAELFVDLEALRDCGFFDGLERSAAFRMLASMLRTTAGLDVHEVKRVRVASGERAGEGDPGIERVTILEGTAALTLPAATEERTRDVVAGVPVLRERGFAVDAVWVSPRPGLLVIGPDAWVAPVLRRERRGGVPHPDLMAMTAVRSPMLYVATARCGLETATWLQRAGIPAEWVGDDDPLEFAILRVELDGAGQIVVSVEAGFRDGTSGPRRFVAGFDEATGSLAAGPELGPAQQLLEKLERAQRGSVLVLSLELGPPREAGERLAALLVPTAFVRK